MYVNKIQRLHYIDIAKGILILLLLVSHLGIALKWCDIDDTNPNFLPWHYPQPLFTCFFMQCFFIISGYCSNFTVEGKTFVSKLARQLIIPWLFFELVRVVFFYSQGQITQLFPSPTFTTLWFLNALIFSKIICYTIYRLSKSTLVTIGIAFLLLVIGVTINQFDGGGNSFNPLCYKQSLIDTFFVAFGFLLKKYYAFDSKYLKYAGIIFIVIMIGRFLHVWSPPGQDANIGVGIIEIPFFLITSISGSLMFIYICQKIAKNHFFEFYGRNSLTVYGLHMWPYMIIIPIVNNFITPTSQLNALIFLFTIYSIEILFLFIFIRILNLKYIRILIGK